VGETFTPDITGDAWAIAQGHATVDANIREVRYRLQIDNVDDPATQTTDQETSGEANDSSQDPTDRNQFGRQTVKAMTGSQTYTFDWEGYTNGAAVSVDQRALCVFSFELAAAAASVAPYYTSMGLMGVGH
jgi:hypothetical protein